MIEKVPKSYTLRKTFSCDPCRAKGYVVLLNTKKARWRKLTCKQCLPKGRVWPEICIRCARGKRGCGPGRTAPRAGGRLFTAADGEETNFEASNQVVELMLSTSNNYDPATSVEYLSNDYQLAVNQNGGMYEEQGDAIVYHVNHYSGEYTTGSADGSYPYQVEDIELRPLPETTYEEADNTHTSQALEPRVIYVNPETQLSHTTSRVTELNVHAMPGPTHMAYHNYRIHMIWRLQNRVARLWANYQTFAGTGAVSKSFSLTVSRFFGEQCTHYAAIVGQARNVRYKRMAR